VSGSDAPQRPPLWKHRRTAPTRFPDSFDESEQSSRVWPASPLAADLDEGAAVWGPLPELRIEDEQQKLLVGHGYLDAQPPRRAADERWCNRKPILLLDSSVAPRDESGPRYSRKGRNAALSSFSGNLRDAPKVPKRVPICPRWASQPVRHIAVVANRSYGTGRRYIVLDRGGRASWYGSWWAGGTRVKRKIGLKRTAGNADGLTRTQAER
jgi:hypothetical protein